MGLSTNLKQELETLYQARGPVPASLRASDARGLMLRIEVVTIDLLGCAVSELELFVPTLQSAAFDVLKQWADALSQRITYLLEQIGPLEFDEAAGQVLIRSVSPDQLPDGAQYYEILLSQRGSGTFLLKRYKSTKGQSGRTPVEMLLTREVILKLVDDLEATVP
ncbi:MAG: hypothetical protein KDA58_00210 [Planctomycetaceae bacterium]|nr:hypothetical protein [Planctomycetaceae bacterium]